MSIHPLPQIAAEDEARLVASAQEGDRSALGALVEPLRRPLFAYIYRMVSLRQDAEDLLQDVLVRVLESLPSYRSEARFKTWLFGIATHVSLDHLRHRRRWRVEAQLEGEREAHERPEQYGRVAQMLSAPGFAFEIREHIAFCFSCIARTLEPEEQAALMLREVLGFTAEEAAGILNFSEPVFRHRLSDARAKMTQRYEGLCQLINKTGACWQCKGLREFAPKANRGADLVQIEVAPGLAVTPKNLFEARLGIVIVRDADLENGRTRTLHDAFFTGISHREEDRT
jgi:RNA polymerase sigma-70 factor (ECF subfamily)